MWEFTMYDKTKGEEFILVGTIFRITLLKAGLLESYDKGEVVLLRSDYID